MYTSMYRGRDWRGTYSSTQGRRQAAEQQSFLDKSLLSRPGITMKQSFGLIMPSIWLWSALRVGTRHGVNTRGRGGLVVSSELSCDEVVLY